MTSDAGSDPISILVTGAAGFIGQHVVACLLNRGHRVVALQHRKRVPRCIEARCEVCSGDICEPGTLKQVLGRVEAVCHVSAYIPVKLNDLSEAAACYRVNAQAALDLAREASRHGVRQFVYTSSGSLYVPLQRPCTETDPVFPDQHATSYLASKLAGEIYLSHVARHSEMQAVTLRVGTPYGPGAPLRQVIPVFMRRAAQGMPLIVLNGGIASYNFVWVEDVAYCVARAVESKISGTYNVAAGEHTSLRCLADTVVEVFGNQEVAVHVEPVSDPGYTGLPALSIARACQAWEFAPLALDQGLDRYRLSLSTAGGGA